MSGGKNFFFLSPFSQDVKTSNLADLKRYISTSTGSKTTKLGRVDLDWEVSTYKVTCPLIKWSPGVAW